VGGLWSAIAEPPRWHSVAKTLQPDVPTARVLDAVAPFARCSVAGGVLHRVDDAVELWNTWAIGPRVVWLKDG